MVFSGFLPRTVRLSQSGGLHGLFSGDVEKRAAKWCSFEQQSLSRARSSAEEDGHPKAQPWTPALQWVGGVGARADETGETYRRVGFDPRRER
uniref:Uncharacterized protein n=1 Tax=Knipowitschia caucasica TaxID=637954 RepID=A0AAV2L5F2_KNICA